MLTRKLTKAIVIRQQVHPAKSVAVIPEAQEVPEVQEAPEAPEALEVQEAPEAQEEPEAPEVQEAPEAQEEPEAPEAQEEPEAPEAQGYSVEELLSKTSSEIQAQVNTGDWDLRLDDLISWEKLHKNRKGVVSSLESRKASTQST